MNAPLDLRMDQATFLDWIQSQPRRCELVGGRVVTQQGGTWDHSRISARFVKQLSLLLDDEEWSILTGDLAVDVGSNTRFPDVLVARAPHDGKALSTDEPVILVEVLSPSSEDDDFRVKAAEYMSLASLEAYIVASQDAAQCWVWQREDRSERPFQAEPTEIAGLGASIALSAVGISLPLTEIYRGIVKA